MKQGEFELAASKLIAVTKTIVGADAPTWQRGRDADELRLKLPLEVSGELCGAYLLVMVYPDYHSLKFRLAVEFHSKVIDRLDYEMDVAHANNAGYGDLVQGPHWHKWEDNRHLTGSIARLDKLPIAVAFTGARQFDAALRLYCASRNILVADHGVQFPPRTKLL